MNKLNPNQFMNPFEELEKIKYRVIFFGSIWFCTAFNIISLSITPYLIAIYIILEHFKLNGFREFGQLFMRLIILVSLMVVYVIVGVTIGIIGTILFLLSIAAWTLWKGRSQYMNGLRHIETRIFGKPLDKKYWKKGELKALKMRVKL